MSEHRVGGLSFISIACLSDPSALNDWQAADVVALHQVRDFVFHFLARAHANLGRSGPVCPFIRGSARLNAIRLAVSHVEPGDADQLASDICAAEIVFSQQAKDMASADDRMFAAAILVLPRLASKAGAVLLNQLQREAKLRFVQQGRMIGQFYPGCAEPGLHSPSFRPLDAPVPFIAIRHMAIQDAPFMLGDHRYRQSYLEHFGEEGARRLMAAQPAAAPQAAIGL
ncbi:MAG: DUF6875 domain-containing protein [Sphingomonas sp.]